MSLLTVENVTKGFNERVLLRGVSLAIGEGERVGLLGPNGCGKTTLLKVLAGVEPFDSGVRTLRRDVRLGYLEQEPALDGASTAREIVRGGIAGREQVLEQLERVHRELESAREEALERALARQSRLETELERLGGHDVEHRIESTLQSLGLEQPDALCGPMSGGERRRVALARLLVSAPDLLLLDEPTNHLDALVTEWLEDWFLETRTPLLMVTHDRYFLDRVVDRIVELDRGELFEYIGGYGDYLEKRAERLDAERSRESARQLLVRRETVWMRRGAPARTTKAKARIKRYENLVDSEPVALPSELELEIPPGPRLGTRVIEAHGLTKRFGERVVLAPIDLEIGPQTRLGIVGPNGAGKTTLLKLILGELAPDGGTLELGETVRFARIDQQRAELSPENTVIEEVAGRSDVVKVGDRTLRVESFLDRFLFPGPMKFARVKQLSGGERNRILLAKLLCAGGNVLVLDEPTNDLDLPTLRALEEALLVFPGAVLVVSHDRWFLDRIATHILYFDGRGGVRLHVGDLTSLFERLAQERAAQSESAAKAPKVSAPARAEAADKPAAKARRITPWQRKELDELPEKIAALERELGELDARLAEPSLYSGPKSELERVRARRAEVDAQNAALYARWEELEALAG
jgi:ATP-binding cassette subfamily F protein uup